jgi:SAM-dependent methyltransferase
MTRQTIESQYNACLRNEEQNGSTSLGLMSNFTWNQDPKRLTFLLSRYKFVSKMLAGCDSVLEVGCADAFGTRLVRQTVNAVTAIDFDPVFVEDALRRRDPRWPISILCHDMLNGPVAGNFDAAYSLDVLEHITPDKEHVFVQNITDSLKLDGCLILGMPSLESQQYASEESKIGHVNCKTGSDLKRFLKYFFSQVFLFSMNDEVVHTGYYPMAHYLLALCCGLKNRN